MKKIKLILSIVLLIIVIVVLIYLIENLIVSKQMIPDSPLINEKSLIDINLKDANNLEILYKTANNTTELYDIKILLTGEEAYEIIKELDDNQYFEIEGLNFISDNYNYIINFSNGIKFICVSKESNIVLCQTGDNETFIEIPAETMKKISRYVYDELNKKQLLYETDKMILKTQTNEITLTSNELINIILCECRENFLINEAFENKNIKCTLIFKDTIKLNILEEKIKGNNIAELFNGDEKFFVYVSDDLIQILSNILENNEKNLLSFLDTNEIILKKDNKINNIIDKTIIQDITQLLMSSKINYNINKGNINFDGYTEILLNDNIKLNIRISKDALYFTGYITIKDVTYTIDLRNEFSSYIKAYI